MEKEKRLYIQTIGCQMNVRDSETMAGLLHPLGYRLTDSVKEADLVIANTCAVREKAVQKAFSFLGRLADLKRRNPRLIVAVGGCVAQQEGEKILRRVPCVDVVFGTRAVSRLPEIIERVAARRRRIVDVEMGDEIDPVDAGDDFDTGITETGISRFVTIMQGCDNFCAYCVVPHVRGRERSRPPERIIAEIEAFVASGVREITLLGQNVNSYGRKDGLPCDFPELLRRVNAVEGLTRIRFTTSHPKDLSPELTQCFRELEKLCGHIHLPVQSGSNRVLKRMNRRYTREDYLEKVNRLRDARPDIAVTTDLIAGFPGETREDFTQTLDLMNEVSYDSVFAFMYSDRPQTKALNFPDKVPEAERRDRLREILSFQEGITMEKHRALVGTVQEVLVEGESRRQAGSSSEETAVQLSGRTGGNKIVNFNPEKSERHPDSFSQGNWVGECVRVRIEEAFPHSLRGTPQSVES